MELKLNDQELERMTHLAHRRGLSDLTAYVRQLVDADAQQPLPSLEHEQGAVNTRLHRAGLLVENWDSLDQEIAELVAAGVAPLTEPIRLPPGSRPSEALIAEDRDED
ncbi:MAG TPA: hypothetical protein VHD90_14655 [Phototrophicaceae bacterium]|nr:hypothetical protein [Phototrophicaceae bacterium]